MSWYESAPAESSPSYDCWKSTPPEDPPWFYEWGLTEMIVGNFSVDNFSSPDELYWDIEHLIKDLENVQKELSKYMDERY